MGGVKVLSFEFWVLGFESLVGASWERVAGEREISGRDSCTGVWFMVWGWGRGFEF